MIDQEKSYIKQIVQTKQWSVLERFAQQLIDKIEKESTVRDSEWETIKTTLENEGKVQGIKQLLQELFTIGANE